MSATSGTSRIEAVNTMLIAIGQSPVNSLNTGSVDSEIAENILDEVTREVCSRGWHFNTEHDFVLASTVGTGEVPVPTDAARVDVDRNKVGGDEITVLDGKLYNLTEHTAVFNRSVKASVVWLRSFEQVPESARNYIMIRAARKMGDRRVVDPSSHNFTLRDEFMARADLQRHDTETGDYNVFRNRLAWNTARRRRSPFNH